METFRWLPKEGSQQALDSSLHRSLGSFAGHGVFRVPIGGGNGQISGYFERSKVDSLSENLAQAFCLPLKTRKDLNEIFPGFRSQTIPG
jgi:hypothetical protein